MYYRYTRSTLPPVVSEFSQKQNTFVFRHCSGSSCSRYLFLFWRVIFFLAATQKLRRDLDICRKKLAAASAETIKFRRNAAARGAHSRTTKDKKKHLMVRNEDKEEQEEEPRRSLPSGKDKAPPCGCRGAWLAPSWCVGGRSLCLLTYAGARAVVEAA